LNPDDPNLQRVELVARALGALCEELVFVGGSATGLHVLDGRPAVVAEIAETGGALGDYLALRFREVVSHPDFENILPGLVVYDGLYGSRIEAVRERARAIAGLSGAAQ